jgi:DNA-binding transcriptional MerR regulator
MARYKIIIDGGNIKTVQKKIQKAFPGQEVQVEKIKVISSRPDRLGEAEEACENAKSIVEELKGEMEEWHENIPENLQDGSKANEVQECIDALEELNDSLEGIDFSSVSFPSMF